MARLDDWIATHPVRGTLAVLAIFWTLCAVSAWFLGLTYVQALACAAGGLPGIVTGVILDRRKRRETAERRQS